MKSQYKKYEYMTNLSEREVLMKEIKNKQEKQ